MRRRDFLKNKAISTNDLQKNNATKLAKKRYFILKTWKLAKAIHVKLGILLTSVAHGIVVSRPIFWKSKLRIERTTNNADDGGSFQCALP